MDSENNILLLWPNDTHNVWRGYFKLLDENFNLTILFVGKNYENKNINIKNGNIYHTTQDNLVQKLKEIHKRHKVDIILTYHFYELYTWKALLFTNIPIINLESMHLPPKEWKKHLSLKDKFERFIFFKVKDVMKIIFNMKKIKNICMTKRSYNFMKDLGFKNLDYCLIPYYYFWNDNTNSSHEHGETNSRFTAIYVGRFVEMKNLETVLYGIYELYKDNIISPDNFLFEMYGNYESSDNYLKPILKKLNNLKLIKLHPPQPHEELNKIYHSADIFIMPSYDVLGVVTLESIENELPVVIGSKSGFAEKIRKWLGSDFVFENRNINSFKSKLLNILENRDNLKNKGKTARKLFDKDQKYYSKKFIEIVNNFEK